MRHLLNLIYLGALLVLAPWLLVKALTAGKYRRGLWAKAAGAVPLRGGDAPCAWFHGVSVGEVLLLRQVVARFRRRYPHWQCVVSTTTDTGYDEARKHFADLPVFYWPLDFSWAVRRALDRIRPDLVVLGEGELWPNFLGEAKRQRIPVAVLNGRMSPRSARRYRRFGWLARHWLGKVDLFLMQTAEYAFNLRALGVPADRIVVTGSVKFDGVMADRHNPRTEELRRLFAVERGQLVWVAGSTQDPEEPIALEIFQRLQSEYPTLRLFLVPRQKDRFEEVAGLLKRSGTPFVRRSELIAPVTDPRAVVLVDTIGELGALWGLADLAFVGGSLDGRRGGQNMIEPAAYGTAVVFGPHVWNFRDTAARLVEAGAAVQVTDVGELERTVRHLLADADRRRQLGDAAQRFVCSQQGATEKALDGLAALLAPLPGRSDAA